MSRHYSAYQYDAAYRPEQLKNWEVPQYYCDKPRQRYGKTSIIANSRGHILPGVPKPRSNPWGNFIGTWHLPKKITRCIADVINGTTEGRKLVQKCLLYAKQPVKQTRSTIQIKENGEKKSVKESYQEEDVTEKSQGQTADLEEINNIFCPIHDFRR